MQDHQLPVAGTVQAEAPSKGPVDPQLFTFSDEAFENNNSHTADAMQRDLNHMSADELFTTDATARNESYFDPTTSAFDQHGPYYTAETSMDQSSSVNTNGGSDAWLKKADELAGYGKSKVEDSEETMSRL